MGQQVQVDLDYLRSIENQLKEYKEKSENLEIELKKYDTESLTDKAVNLSFRLFAQYALAIFKEIGFEDTDVYDTKFSGVRYSLYEEWWNDKNLKVELGATISNKMRKAFLNIGIDTSIKKQKKEIYKL